MVPEPTAISASASAVASRIRPTVVVVGMGMVAQADRNDLPRGGQGLLDPGAQHVARDGIADHRQPRPEVEAGHQLALACPSRLSAIDDSSARARRAARRSLGIRPLAGPAIARSVACSCASNLLNIGFSD